MKTWMSVIKRGIKKFNDNRMSVYSGYTTVFMVTAMIPFTILIISIVGMIPGYSAEDATGVILQFLPDLGAIEDLVIRLIDSLKDQSSGLLASVAAVTTLWSASKGVMAIQKGLNELDDDDDEDKPKAEGKEGLLATAMEFIKAVLKRLFYTLSVIILIPALLIVEMLGDSVPDKIAAFFQASSILVVLLAFVVTLIAYANLPAKHRSFKSQIPGAALSAVCWYVFTELFSIVVPLIYHASYLYGTLASIFFLLLWVRYVIMIFFAGAVMNHVIEESKEE